MRKTRFFRSRLWYCFALFAAAIFILLWILQTVFLQTFYDDMLIDRTRKAAAEITEQGKSDDLTDIIDQLSLDNSLIVFITDTEGTILYSSDAYKSYYHEENAEKGETNPYLSGKTLNWQTGNYRNLPDGYADFLSALKESGNGTTEIRSGTQYVYGTGMELKDGKEAVLYTSITLGEVGAAVSIIRMQLLWVSVISLLLAFVIAWFLARKFSLPVDQLTVQAKMLAADSYETVFEKGFCTELDELADSMDETAVKLAEAKKYQKELLANVSHDLRTPITMIRGYAEMVRDISWEDEAARNADIGIIIREADRLTGLVNEILEYSALQESGMVHAFASVDLSSLVRSVSAQFEALACRDGIVIEKNIADGCMVQGNEELLQRIIYNLIDNALRHTGENRKITLTLCDRDSVCFEVRDYGAGIDASELPHIWEKYYTSRQRGNKGVSGLGLAIVKQIAEIHGADCGIDSKKGEGSCFWVAFKKEKGPAAADPLS